MNFSSFIDHTCIKPPVVEKDIQKTCEEAMIYEFFSVCVPPCYVSYAKKILKGTTVKVGTVIGFPFGYSTPHVKYLEARNAEAKGAQELDLVMNIGHLKERRYNCILKEIESVVSSFPHVTHKIIIETGLLTVQEKKEAALLVKKSGADFIKTSTGFFKTGANSEDIILLKSFVGDKPKIKASGGIRTFKAAETMIHAGALRIGTSFGVSIIKEYNLNN